MRVNRLNNTVGPTYHSAEETAKKVDVKSIRRGYRVSKKDTQPQLTVTERKYRTLQDLFK